MKPMIRRFLLLITCIMLMNNSYAQQTIVVKKGDAQSLLDAVSEANKRNADKDAPQLYILIPDGFYDLGEKVLTRITGHHIAFIGESMEGTIIQNKPHFKNEGLSKTAIFQNRGWDNYFQDMTLKNALDYYAAGAAGRAATLHDKGYRTICNRVKLLSYQDTYYSDTEDGQYYFQDSEIHGTVDFICGGGDVWFEKCRIVTEKRTLDGSGRCVIAAPRTSNTRWGYIFNDCTIENIVSNFELARGWNATPRCIWLNTKLLSPEKLNETRFDWRGMNTVRSYFKEYGTKDASGRDITPQTNVVTFKMTKKRKDGDREIVTESSHTDETVMGAAEAASYTRENVFGSWEPMKVIRKMEGKSKKLLKRLQ